MPFWSHLPPRLRETLRALPPQIRQWRQNYLNRKTAKVVVHWALHGVFWFYRLVRQVIKQALANQTASAASEMAFNAMLSIFPALLIVAAAVGMLATSGPILGVMVTTLQELVPVDAASLLSRGLEELARGAGQQTFSFGIIATLWLASAFFSPVIRALNNSYQVPRELLRPWWLDRLFAIGIFVGTVSLVLMASVLMVAGQLVLYWGATRAGWSEAFILFWRLMILPLSVLLIVLSLAFIYRVAPAQQPEYAPVWPGAIAGSGIWLVVSVGFRVYVQNFGRYEAVYGSIGAVIVLLLWLYLSAFGMLLGGEVNAAIHHLRWRHAEARDQLALTEGLADQPLGKTTLTLSPPPDPATQKAAPHDASVARD